MDRKLRLLFITRAYGLTGGGMERLSWELINEISKLPEVHAKVIWHRGKRVWWPIFLLTGGFKALIVAKNFDVIHLGDPLLSKIGWLIKLILRKPVAVTVHGLDVSYSNTVYRLYLRLFFRNFDLYLPISKYAKNLLVKYNVKGRVEVINPGVRDRFYDPSIKRNRLAKLLGRDVTDAKVLITVGRLVRRKGHEWFIQRVLPKLPASVIYVIVGDGPERMQINKAAIDNGLSQRVIMLGRVNDHKLKVIYNSADVFIQPNIRVEGDTEGFGLVLLEAASCGLPVFASRLEGITDAIQDRKNGTLIESEDVESWIRTFNLRAKTYSRIISARKYTLTNFSAREKSNRLLNQLRFLVK